MGGHFEILVRTIKASLASAISKNLLTLEEFVTIVKEAENVVNSRPPRIPERRFKRYSFNSITISLGERHHPNASTPAAQRPP